MAGQVAGLPGIPGPNSGVSEREIRPEGVVENSAYRLTPQSTEARPF